MSAQSPSRVNAIEWRNNRLYLLDQRILPHEQVWIECTSAADTAIAIRDMVVRGAPAIGITAAYGYALEALRGGDMTETFRVLAASRPTAVNLFWALERMATLGTTDAASLVAEAIRIHEEDIAANLAMGNHGASVMPEGVRIYTHCNTGALATGGHGTALGVIRSAWNDGKVEQVYAGETRPWLQGARLTAWELQQDNITASLVCDGAAAQLFRQGKADWVIVGADRITANGDVANKIGTYSLAVLARHHGMKFMVAAPLSTFDLSLSSGDQIPIEQRPMSEVTSIKGIQIAPHEFPAINPSFDVTPAELIDVIATEAGLIHNPSKETVAALFARARAEGRQA
ncbi:S-methyl-5-thioribose-1-phosphate isomerase [Parathalassolituus penaei]|uniref:Methylthioribose-1-phosphate isomerase n=1 Tax=Parathalassolituus penaei TaxID=2997323 RepID=A0A9X3EB93_9GAMM|nr:S-methyl-5-thioribose-1-phosphate isomerase [Parathalassolituus penaei]MCY0964368.1 S-methyl-5-thioribose-1-phosphate isomerase [Parathalassolituus penaei]